MVHFRQYQTWKW